MKKYLIMTALALAGCAGKQIQEAPPTLIYGVGQGAEYLLHQDPLEAGSVRGLEMRYETKELCGFRQGSFEASEIFADRFQVVTADEARRIQKAASTKVKMCQCEAANGCESA